MRHLFARPTPLQMEEAFEDGFRAFHSGRANPYSVGGEPVAPLLWWAFDSGLRLGRFLEAEKVRKFNERLAERRTFGAMVRVRGI